MKNKKVLMSLLALLFVVTGCTKVALKPSEFKKKMEERKYVISNSSEYYPKEYITTMYVALGKNSNYQIDYYELATEKISNTFYDNSKKSFIKEKKSSDIEKIDESEKYSRYSLETKDSYKVLIKIDKMVILVDAKKKYKDKIEKTLSEIGY